MCCVAVFSRSVMSDSWRPHGLEPARFLCPRGFSRQEYWSGLPYSPSGNLPNPGIKPGFPALQADSLPAELPGKPANKHEEQKDEAQLGEISIANQSIY